MSSALAKTARHRPMLLSLLAGGTRNAAQIVLMTFVPIYARDELGFDLTVDGRVRPFQIRRLHAEVLDVSPPGSEGPPLRRRRARELLPRLR